MTKPITTADRLQVDGSRWNSEKHGFDTYVSQPYGPRGDKYVWAGYSCRTHGGGQERCGTKMRVASLSCYGEQLGSLTVKAWASPLACPLP